MSDLIDRQAAITQLSHNKNKGDDEWELAVESDIQTIWKLPSAQPTFDARDTQYNLPIGTDLISKKAVLVAVKDALMAWSYMPEWRDEKILKAIAELPSAQPEVKQISYTDCANAMLMMWMDKVLTDGEYNRIMDKLNEHEKKKRGRQ